MITTSVHLKDIAVGDTTGFISVSVVSPNHLTTAPLRLNDNYKGLFGLSIEDLESCIRDGDYEMRLKFKNNPDLSVYSLLETMMQSAQISLSEVYKESWKGEFPVITAITYDYKLCNNEFTITVIPSVLEMEDDEFEGVF